MAGTTATDRGYPGYRADDARYSNRAKARAGAFALPLGRAAALPAVMSSPPTFTLSAAFGSYTLALAGSSFTSAKATYALANPDVDDSLDTRSFTFMGAAAVRRGTSTGTIRRVLQSSTAVTGTPTGAPHRVEFVHYGAAFEIMLLGLSNALRMWVDGVPVTQRVSSVGTPNDGNPYLWKVAFGSTAQRRITLDLGSAGGFMAIVTGPTDSVSASPIPPGPRLIVGPGDSFVDGANGVSAIDTFAFSLGHMLGIRDVWCSGIGGTGFVQTGGAGKNNFQTRVTPDVASRNPDIVLVPGSVNDPNNASIGAPLQAAAVAVYQAIRSANPRCLLIATGIISCAGNAITANQITATSDLATAAANSGAVDLFINAYPAAAGNQQNWFTGTGNSGTPTGNGNADVFHSNDGTHPTQAGHDYLAMRVASAINTWLRSA